MQFGIKNNENESGMKEAGQQLSEEKKDRWRELVILKLCSLWCFSGIQKSKWISLGFQQCLVMCMCEH